MTFKDLFFIRKGQYCRQEVKWEETRTRDTQSAMALYVSALPMRLLPVTAHDIIQPELILPSHYKVHQGSTL